MFAYGLAGMFAALDSGQPAVGEGWTIVGTGFGTWLMAVVSNGLSLLNASGYWDRVVVGTIMLVAVLTDFLLRRE